MLFSTVNENQWPFTYSTFSITRHNTFRNGTLLHHLCSIETLQLHCQLKCYHFAHNMKELTFSKSMLTNSIIQIYIYCDIWWILLCLQEIYNLFYTYLAILWNYRFGRMHQILTVDSACLNSHYPIGLFVIPSKEQKEDTIFSILQTWDIIRPF